MRGLYMSSFSCIQEFWVGSDELVEMYDTRLGDAGYVNFKLARTNNRGDGMPFNLFFVWFLKSYSYGKMWDLLYSKVVC